MGQAKRIQQNESSSSSSSLVVLDLEIRNHPDYIRFKSELTYQI